MASEAEIAAMRQAIMLSASGLGTTSPNPPVGCVILGPDGRVVGSGFHRRKGEPHAEVNALQAAGEAARGGTAVVTLEPCNHVGVTPACRQELLDAGITRVVIGMMDPTSRGDGGAAVLAGANIDVEFGVLSEEVLTVLRPWLSGTLRSRPYITWVFSDGVDGPGRPDPSLVRSLQSAVDVVVSDGSINEGVPGGHSPQHFQLDQLGPFEGDPHAWLTTAHQAGVRSMLVTGNSRAVAGLQAVDAIDEILVITLQVQDSQPPTRISDCLTGYEITSVAGWDRYLLSHLRRLASTLQ